MGSSDNVVSPFKSVLTFLRHRLTIKQAPHKEQLLQRHRKWLVEPES
jgi:hypothetical protein